MPIDLEEIAVKSGIKRDMLSKEISVMEAMQSIFAELGNSNQRVALFGGTALNKIYYGEKQRLSYDLDIESFSFGATLRLMQRISKLAKPPLKIASRFEYKGVIVDLFKGKELEKPRLRTATSILGTMGYPMASVSVPSYSLELLLAKKTIAMLSRMVYKDIYDMWIGLQMMKETDRYAEYLKKLIRYEKTDASLLLKQFEYYSGHYPPAKLRESIAAAYAIPNTGIVVNDVISKLESILE